MQPLPVGSRARVGEALGGLGRTPGCPGQLLGPVTLTAGVLCCRHPRQAAAAAAEAAATALAPGYFCDKGKISEAIVTRGRCDPAPSNLSSQAETTAVTRAPLCRENPPRRSQRDEHLDPGEPTSVQAHRCIHATRLKAEFSPVSKTPAGSAAVKSQRRPLEHAVWHAQRLGTHTQPRAHLQPRPRPSRGLCRPDAISSQS